MPNDLLWKASLLYELVILLSMREVVKSKFI